MREIVVESEIYDDPNVVKNKTDDKRFVVGKLSERNVLEKVNSSDRKDLELSISLK